MGACDGADVYELIGIFMRHKLSTQYDKHNIGLYIYDGLVMFKNISGPESERTKKNFKPIFKENGLEIIIDATKNSRQPIYHQ